MPIEAVLAAISFVALGMVWVVLPSQIKKRHASKVEESTER